MSYPYTRYLASKKSVDDRALHQGVVAELRRRLPAGPVRVLEIGAGLGTMVARLLEWELLSAGDYVLLDVDRQLLLDSRHWLCEWGQARGVVPELSSDWLGLGEVRVHFVEAEIGSCRSTGHAARVVSFAGAGWNLLVHYQFRWRDNFSTGSSL